MTTVSQTKPQPQPQQTRPDAIDAKFDAAIGLPPATYEINYHLAYLKELRDRDQVPF